MCGIAGYAGKGDVVTTIISLLIELQHRGQEAAGIAVVAKSKEILTIRVKGLAIDILANDAFHKLSFSNPCCGIGHVRYSTTGGYMDSQAQPITVGEGLLKIAVAFNGTIANYVALAKEFGLRSYPGDTYVLAEVLYRLALEYGKDVVEALKHLAEYVIGGYSIAVLTSEPRLVIARDPYGFRPLTYSYDGETFVFASETAALDVLGFRDWREVGYGQILSFDGKSLEATGSSIHVEPAPCIFEYVYFSRPDSIFNGVSVYSARVRMGEELARNSPADGDVVIPVPDSGRAAAIGFSKASGIPLEEGIIANKYVGRGFIMPPQIRDSISRLKYGFIRSIINGKRVVLVDDSLVRGTTLKNIVSRLREAGAKEVHVRIASPPFRYPCFMGIDVASREELLAWRYISPSDIAKAIGADSLGYNTIESLLHAVQLQTVCTACFTGRYPFKNLTVDYLGKMF
jgi:amidophosphoribosyltransferase